MHLIKATEKQGEGTVTALKDLDVARIGISRCTGLPAAEKLAAAFGGRVFANNAGTCITIDDYNDLKRNVERRMAAVPSSLSGINGAEGRMNEIS